MIGMSSFKTTLWIATFVASSAALAQETTPTAAELVAKNLAARGGVETWSKVQSLELKGKFDAWSDPVPMTIERARPAKYRFEHKLFGAPAVLASDGETPWLHAAALGAEQPTPIEDGWKRNVVEDTGFVNRLQQLAEQKVPMEVLGRGDVDGVAAWKLRATPAGAPPEVWYLDARTGLELARESTTFDVFSGAIEMPMQTYYMDFREVEGLKFPFREERHFGTRYHLYEVESVKLDPALDPARFAAPKKAPEPKPAP